MSERIRFPSVPALSSSIRDGNYSTIPSISYNVIALEEVSNEFQGTEVLGFKSKRVFNITILLFYINVTKVNQVIDSIITSVTGSVDNDLNPGNEIDKTLDFDPEMIVLSQFDNRSTIKTIDIYVEINRVKKQFIPQALGRIKTQIQQLLVLNTGN